MAVPRGPWGGAFQGLRRYPGWRIRAEHDAAAVAEVSAPGGLVTFGEIRAQPVDVPTPVRGEGQPDGVITPATTGARASSGPLTAEQITALARAFSEGGT